MANPKVYNIHLDKLATLRLNQYRQAPPAAAKFTCLPTTIVY